MKDIQLRNVINKINDINIIPEEDDLLIKDKDDDLEDLFIEGKSNQFKLNLTKIFMYFDEHYILTTFIKLFFGLIFLFLPLLLILIISFLNLSSTSKNNFIFFPCFISLNLILGLLLFLLVIKIAEVCQMNGFLAFTWERKNIFRIVNSFLNGIFLLWFLFWLEKFYKWFNLLKEKVAQTNSGDSAKLFDRGTYTERILFILCFWDQEKDSNGEYIHKKLNYFEYETSVFDEFHSYLYTLLIPIVVFGCINLFRLIFLKYKDMLFALIFYILIIFISFFIMFYSNKENNTNKSDNKIDYFSNINCKYIELVTYILIILILIVKSFMMYFKLIKKKYISKKKDNNKFMTIISLISFLISFSGYALLTSDISFMCFDDINEDLPIEKYHKYWNLLYISLGMILFGYVFILGHTFFNLVFYPVAYEITPHDIKNKFYVKSSGTIIETKENMNPKTSYSHKQINLIFDKI